MSESTALQPMNPAEQINVLGAFARSLRREGHLLAANPDLAFQQLHNRLQWEGTAVGAVVNFQRARRSAPGARPWVRTRAPFAESDALVRTLTGHRGKVNACAFSPDGTRVVSGGEDGTARIWDVATGTVVRTLVGHAAEVTRCAFDPSGSRVFSASLDETLKVWDAHTCQELATLNGHTDWVLGAAFSPDGSHIISASKDGTLREWDITDETTHVVTFERPDEVFVPWKPPPKPRSAGHVGPVRTLPGSSARLEDCVYSPDGQRLLSVAYDELKIRDVTTGAALGTLAGDTGFFTAAAWSPDATLVAAASSSGSTRVWGAETGELRAILEGHHSGVASCAFSPDGRAVATAGDDATVMVWDVVTGEHTATMAGHARSVSQCAFSPDGSRVVTASSDGTLKLWDPRLAAPACSPVGHTGGVNSCAFSQDGSRLVSGGADGTVKVWDAEKMAVLRTLTHHLDDVYHHTVSGCAFSPDGSLIVSAGSDGTLRLWDANDGSEIVALRHPYPLGGGSGAKHDVAKCGFSPDGLRIVACSDDATLSVWDVRTGERVHDMRGHDGAVTDCAFSSDGHWIASASADRTLMLWDARTGAPVRTLVGHTAAVQSCAFSPDGHWLVSAGADQTLKLWDADHRAEIVPATRTLAGHTDGVLACTFSSDGRWIISAGADGSVRLWDAERGGEVARLPVTGRVRTVAAHPWLVRAAFGEESGVVGAADVIGIDHDSDQPPGRTMWAS